MSNNENHSRVNDLRASFDSLMAAGDLHAAKALLAPEMAKEHRASLIAQYAVVLFLLDESDALEWLEEAVERGEQPVMANINLGTAREKAGDLDAAQALFEESLSLDPMSSDALLGLGRIHYLREDYERALSAFRRAHTFDRRAPSPLWHLLSVFELIGEWQDAVDTFVLLFDIEDREKVFTSLLKSCQLTSSTLLENFAFDYMNDHRDDFTVITLMAKYYLKNNRAVEAVRVLSAFGDPATASGDWALTKAVAFHDLGFSEKANLLLMSHVKTREPTDLAWPPLLMLQHYLPNRKQSDIARLHDIWAKYQPKERPLRGRQRHSKRVVFVSGDLGNHPVGFFCVPLFAGLKRRGYELHLFDSRPKPDPTQVKLYGCASGVTNISKLSDEVVFESIRELEAGFAFDLSGHTRGSRLSLFAKRIAHYQMTAYGYVNTTRLPAMDGILSDPYQILESEEMSYSEAVLRLPHSYIVYQKPSWFPEVVEREQSKPLTFGSLNRAAKLGPHTVDRFTRLMKEHPSSRLILAAPGLDDPLVKGEILARFAAEGVSEERLIFRGGAEHAHYLGNYNDVDIAIDTAPYSGGLTTCEALTMGVPVLTVPGTTMASRHSFGHLSNAGYPQWSFENEDALVKGSHAVARNVMERRLSKATVRAQVLKSPLCDAERYLDDICELFETLNP